MGIVAITHVPSPHMERCERSYVAPVPVDYGRALRQHDRYCDVLRQCGAEVRTLDVNQPLPDCAFVEDTAIVLEEVAILASMGTESRRGEPAGIAPELRRYREVCPVELPATLEGGDVLPVGRTLLVGLSSRSNQAGVAALEALVRRFGYQVLSVPVRGCLHLKTACTALPDDVLLVNPDWVDVQALRGFSWIRVPDEEPWAANTARIGTSVCLSADHPQTARTLAAMGLAVRSIDVSEFAKAEGGVTCLSLVFDVA
jgi:dimethylargininase